MPLVPMMGEQALDEVATLIRQQLNLNIDIVNDKYTAGQGDAAVINVSHIQPSQVYTSDAVDPLILPSVFVILDRSEHDLQAGNIIKQKHHMLVSILANEREQQRLTRMALRYGLAAHMTLHDAHVPVGSYPTCHILVRSLMHSPTYRSRGSNPDTGGRAFRKDVTLTLEVLQYEAFQRY